MVQRGPSLLNSVKKNTSGTLFIFEVIRFQKKLLNLKEHPIPSLGLPVVLHRESFCIFAFGSYTKHCGSDIGVQAPLHRSPYVFVFFWPSTFSSIACLRRLCVINLQLGYNRASTIATLGLRICAIIRLRPYNTKHFSSDIGAQAPLHRSPYVFVFFDLPPFPASLALRVCALQVCEHY